MIYLDERRRHVESTRGYDDRAKVRLGLDVVDAQPIDVEDGHLAGQLNDNVVVLVRTYRVQTAQVKQA